MSYQMKPLSCEPARLQGLSERMIVSHYENNYGGAVKRLNAISEQLVNLDFANAPNFVINGLKREELIASNSMILHELYFENLAGTGESPAGVLREALMKDFGSIEHWQTEFSSMGKALAGGSGWVLLCYSPRDRKLVNQWAADHTHLLAGGRPLLALDMYEHSYHIDYGAKATAYVDAFMQNIRWSRVAVWYAQACGITAAQSRTVSPAELQAVLRQGEAPMVLDVRRPNDRAQDPQGIPDSIWYSPDEVQQWHAQLPKDKTIVLYCARGRSVSNSVVDILQTVGLNARFIEGGLAAWKAWGEVNIVGCNVLCPTR